MNVPDFMIREHVVCVFSNMNFEFKVVKTWHFSKLVTQLRCLMHFEIFFKKLSYKTFIILIMCYNI